MKKMFHKSVYLLFLSLLLYCTSSIVLSDVQITSLQDFNFGTVFPPYSSNERQTDRVCVYNSDGTTYRITASGLHDSGGLFFMSNGSSTVRYRVRWDGPVGSFVTLTAGQPTNFDGAHQVLLCAGVRNNQLARLRIVVNNGYLSPIPQAGTYTDTLTLLLEPA
jgi:spore coat protein U-like protein